MCVTSYILISDYANILYLFYISKKQVVFYLSNIDFYRENVHANAINSTHFLDMNQDIPLILL